MELIARVKARFKARVSARSGLGMEDVLLVVDEMTKLDRYFFFIHLVLQMPCWNRTIPVRQPANSRNRSTGILWHL